MVTPCPDFPRTQDFLEAHIPDCSAVLCSLAHFTTTKPHVSWQESVWHPHFTDNKMDSPNSKHQTQVSRPGLDRFLSLLQIMVIYPKEERQRQGPEQRGQAGGREEEEKQEEGRRRRRSRREGGGRGNEGDEGEEEGRGVMSSVLLAT